jgi:hypothetical protein
MHLLLSIGCFISLPWNNDKPKVQFCDGNRNVTKMISKQYKAIVEDADTLYTGMPFFWVDLEVVYLRKHQCGTVSFPEKTTNRL